MCEEPQDGPTEAELVAVCRLAGAVSPDHADYTQGAGEGVGDGDEVVQGDDAARVDLVVDLECGVQAVYRCQIKNTPVSG